MLQQNTNSQPKTTLHYLLLLMLATLPIQLSYNFPIKCPKDENRVDLGSHISATIILFVVDYLLYLSVFKLFVAAGGIGIPVVICGLVHFQQYSNNMSSVWNDQINLLCIGDILCGKSTFLQLYTHSNPQNLHYKIYSKINQDQTVVYFHQVKERFGMQAYFSYPFDAVLYFLNIEEYHNPQFAIIEQMAQISKINGTNIFKMPFKVVVLSSKNTHWTRIKQSQKMSLIKQLNGMVDQSMIIFVESNSVFHKELFEFFGDVRNQEAKGIQESLYVDWHMKGMQELLPFQNLILSLKKMGDQLKKLWSKLRFSNLVTKK